MYVCVCNAVTERQIGKAVNDGASTLRELRDQLGVAGECGRCATCARDCLRAALARQAVTAQPVHVGCVPSYSLAAEVA